MGIIIFGIVILAIVIIEEAKKEEKRTKKRESLDAKLSEIPNFTASIKVVGLNDKPYIFATDDEAHQIVYLTESSIKSFSYEDVISVELIVDNEITQRKSTSRAIGGAIAGSLLGGGIGAIVGGLSGGSKQEKRITSVMVKLLIRNTADPTLEINCMSPENPDPSFTAPQCATRIVDTLKVIIDTVDQQAASNSSARN